MNRVEMGLGRSLLKPLKIVKVSKKQSVPDDEKNKDKKPGETQEVKIVTMKLPANFQLAEVVATATKYEVGDVVVFGPSRVVNFELIKDTILVNDFDIIGKWVESNIEENE